MKEAIEDFLEEFIEGYKIGKSAINTTLKAKKLGIKDLENLDSSVSAEFKDELETSAVLSYYVIEEGSKASYLGLFSALILNPIDTYRGLSYSKKKDKK